MTTIIVQKTRRGRHVIITPDKVLIDGQEVFGAQAVEQRQKAARTTADSLAAAGVVNVDTVIGRQVVVTQRADTIVNIGGDVTIKNGRMFQPNPRRKR